MGLSLEALGEQFATDGFVIVPHLFSRQEVKALKEEIGNVLRTAAGEADQDGLSPEDLRKSGVFVGLAANSDIFKAAVGDPRLLDILSVAMKSSIEFISDKVVFKNPKTAFASPWHQDWPYWEGCHKVSVWVPLDDASEANGTLRVIPKTQTQKFRHFDPGENIAFSNRISAELLDESAAVTANVEAGGAVFFHDLTVHGSHASTSPSDRWVWIPTYRDPVAGAADPYYAWAVAAKVLRT